MDNQNDFGYDWVHHLQHLSRSWIKAVMYSDPVLSLIVHIQWLAAGINWLKSVDGVKNAAASKP